MSPRRKCKWTSLGHQVKVPADALPHRLQDGLVLWCQVRDAAEVERQVGGRRRRAGGRRRTPVRPRRRPLGGRLPRSGPIRCHPRDVGEESHVRITHVHRRRTGHGRGQLCGECRRRCRPLLVLLLLLLLLVLVLVLVLLLVLLLLLHLLLLRHKLLVEALQLREVRAQLPLASVALLR